jgi:23S rRNA (guanosine2251-2'-O)-methyltransferase
MILLWNCPRNNYSGGMRNIVLIAHNLRSCHNVGSLLRTAEGLGVTEVILSGYTPYPRLANDPRLPHISAKIENQIHKTALGAETSQRWRYVEKIEPILTELKSRGFTLAAVEQSKAAVRLPDFAVPDNIVLLVGREVAGVEPEILAQMDDILEIPMFGQKESFNVVQAAAMTLYHCRFSS